MQLMLQKLLKSSDSVPWKAIGIGACGLAGMALIYALTRSKKASLMTGSFVTRRAVRSAPMFGSALSSQQTISSAIDAGLAILEVALQGLQTSGQGEGNIE